MKVKSSTVQFEKEKMFFVEELELNFQNNRITHLNIKDKKALEEILWKEGKLLPLYHDIMNRGLQESLILFPHQLTVAEGNCRLVCLRKLHEESLRSDEPTLKKFRRLMVPCKRIVKGTPDTDVDVYLTEIHVGRKKKWPEYNQSKLLYKLKYRDNLPLEEIAQIARSSRPTVTKKIQCYQLTKDYHETLPQDEDFIKKFYYFLEFLHPDLEQFRAKDANVKKFMKWVYYGKFPTSKHVRDLAKIMKNRKAFQKFELTDMDQAVKILLHFDPTIRSPLYRNISKLTEQLHNFPKKELLQIVGNESKKMMITELKNSANELLKYVNELEKREGI